MTRIFSILLAATFSLLIFLESAALAQSPDDVVWVQIEAQPRLSEATARARVYAEQVEDVNGFSLGGGWYAIAVGPYRRADAEQVLRQYVRSGIVPRDSFIQLSSSFRQQFWPVGANVLNRDVAQAPDAPAVPQEPDAPDSASAPAEAPQPTVAQTPAIPVQEPIDETLSEARRSERRLNGQERKDLQIALKWAGHYNAAIDGSFGRGTRNSMAAWQDANNFETTGVLTTLQRATLLKQYNAVLDGLGLNLVRDVQAGIEMVMPTAQVAFARYEAPFAQYDSTGDIGARVLLISQAGDQNTLFGLYDIMQTLEIVPLNGPRERRKSSFTLVGENDRIISETRASLKDGQVKGFTLIWPAGDEARRSRVMAELDKSFTRLPGVLDPAAGGDAEQAIDLVSGLQVRQAKLARSGFFIDRSGTVVTTAEAVRSCGRLTVDGDTDADVLAQDDTNGIAFLKPRGDLAPLAVAAFDLGTPRLQSEVSVAGYSYEGVLSAATLTFGKLADVRGLSGEEHLNRLALKAQAGDAGGPVFDASGNVVGMLLPRPSGAQELPEDVSFALAGGTVAALAAQAGVELTASERTDSIAPRDLRLAAQGMTVLVSCWE
ncbi:peptidoglycan-binding protein [Sulfitobacter sp. M57]|uniref:serine protease n=1 Tax=unclassified Sulfitobacter TaxID=196795 RepID=UPI0023E0CFE7|nr:MULTISPECIES: serine protease [unclassified Sulfitobacter]MDF3414171.1 peptidoglycan-binding protein [Sulfitobacter sp. KE5]MDF3420548.1 peptidoglycan-binding protein [Sulfitobacter sp. KE43]MDF3432717.1 peptidoglycan-binding protein [Sulfitobacter sp. KE42]MDF3458356.1 peptidoglycan-binding protein [Sulfitobacter sp. S74]MDF3462257.1 peptidoglycan-binding protein [Sulfitobacter sp. Ks18]